MFCKCEKLEEVTLPEGIKSIGNSAFAECMALAEIKLPNSLLTLGAYAFSHCYALKSVTIPDKVRSVGTGTFQYCSALEAAVLGEQVLTIESGAFSDCNSLQKLTLYYHLQNLADSVFRWTPLTDVTFYGTQAEWDLLCSRSPNNNGLTGVTPNLRNDIIRIMLTWGNAENGTVDSVAEAAANQVPLNVTVERPAGIEETASVTVMAAAYDTAGRMLGIFSCEVEKDGSTLRIAKLPANTFSIQIMMVDDGIAPLLPAKIIT